MSKQAASVKQPKFDELKKGFTFFPFLNQMQAYLVLLVIGVVFNITSIHNEYALDDGIIIHQNDYVLKGTAGIKEILTKDAYDSFYHRMNATDQLAGGRYRPLSVVSFAMEQEYLHAYKTGKYDAKTGQGTYNCWDLNQNDINDPDEDINQDGVYNEVDCQVNGASLRHAVNIFTYILAVLLLYMFLSTCIFKDWQDLAFLTALIFLMHPMHTEVIANVKSRDEIFSLIFISLTFFFSYRLVDYQNYLGRPSFALTGGREIKILLFIVSTALVLSFLYILAPSGAAIFLPSLIIGGLIIYRSYNSFIGNKQYTKTDLLIWASISFFLALLSKEYAVTLLALIPAMVYIFTKSEINLKQSGLMFGYFIVCAIIMLVIKYNSDKGLATGHKPSMAFWAFPFFFIIGGIFAFAKAYRANDFQRLFTWMAFVTLIYLGFRLIAVKLVSGVPDTEILNNPYLLADGQERWASKVYVLLKYLQLLVFPHPLSSDYSYETIVYRHFGDWDFLLSLVLHLGLGVLALYLTYKRHILGFALLVYFAFLMMIGNILMDIGATMGERLLFHSSIGFAIALAWFILKGFEKLSGVNIGMRRVAMILLMGGVGFLYGCKYWERNWDWKNDITLFIKDANTVPNSVLVLGNAGARWVDLADTKFFNKPPGDSILPPFSTFKDEMLHIKISEDEFKNGLTRDNVISLSDEENKQGLNRRQLCLYKGIGYLKHATQLHPRYVNGYLNLGLAYFKLKRDREALFFWKHAEKLYPNNPYLKNYYIAMYNELLNRGYQKAQRGQLDSAIFELNKCIILDRLNPEGWYNIGGAYYQKKNYARAKYCWEECLKLNPNHAQAKQGLSTIVMTTVAVNTPQNPTAEPKKTK